LPAFLTRASTPSALAGSGGRCGRVFKKRMTDLGSAKNSGRGKHLSARALRQPTRHEQCAMEFGFDASPRSQIFGAFGLNLAAYGFWVEKRAGCGVRATKSRARATKPTHTHRTRQWLSVCAESDRHCTGGPTPE